MKELAAMQAEDSAELRIAEYALVLDWQEVKNHKLQPGEVEKYVDFEQKGPVKTIVAPLISKLPRMKEVRLVNVNETCEEPETTAVRIIIPQDFAGKEWETWRKRPLRAIQHLLNNKEASEDARVYGWREMQTESGDARQRTLVGYVKVLRGREDFYLRMSGYHGVFTERLRGEGEKPKVMWLKREKQEANEDYWKRAMREAQKRNTDQKVVSLSWRRGRGADLGLRGVEFVEDDDGKCGAWTLMGAPRWLSLIHI
eukprot:1808684-Karenia_brevis.AAC.1